MCYKNKRSYSFIRILIPSVPFRKAGLVGVAVLTLTAAVVAEETNPAPVMVNTVAEPVQTGIFQPTWESLKQYQCPEWFRDAKFGIWAHWGPQCEPEDGDWYARFIDRKSTRLNSSHR